MKIGNHEVGGSHPALVVSEIGISHNGSLDLALKMIAESKRAGAQLVKFQKRTVDLVYTAEELARPRESPFGTTNGDLKRGLEFGQDEYAHIDAYCEELGIPWFASPWDIESVAFLAQFDMAAWKIPSALVTDLALIDAVRKAAVPDAARAEEAKPIIISTGMSDVLQIDEAVRTASCGRWSNPRALLACTASYPADPHDLNLNRLRTLQEIYPSLPVGWSGHEVGVYTSVAAVALGAKIVERHFTLDRSSWGSDQAASLEPQGFRKMVEETRTLESALGSPELRLLDCERDVMAKLRRTAA
jgi:N-acetylneuraminate synthase